MLDERIAAVASAVLNPPYSRASATAYLDVAGPFDQAGTQQVQPIRLPVFPCTKFAVIVRGARPAVDDDGPPRGEIAEVRLRVFPQGPFVPLGKLKPTGSTSLCRT